MTGQTENTINSTFDVSIRYQDPENEIQDRAVAHGVKSFDLAVESAKRAERRHSRSTAKITNMETEEVFLSNGILIGNLDDIQFLRRWDAGEFDTF